VFSDVSRTILLRLTDMRDAINGIEGVVVDATFEAFAHNWGMQRAVERGLEIISEASRHIPPDLTALAPEIPWRQIAAIGNLLRHEYQRADIKATWNIVKEHLPPLAVATDRLIAEGERREKG
jgi:uncharacterized protein with HEPN domain